MEFSMPIALPSGSVLVKFRLWFYALAWLHLVFTAIVSLSVDMSEDQDPKVSAYINIRWKLITCWFNVNIASVFFLIRSFHFDLINFIDNII